MEQPNARRLLLVVPGQAGRSDPGPNLARSYKDGVANSRTVRERPAIGTAAARIDSIGAAAGIIDHLAVYQ